jgi:hypothetical protein
MSLAGLSFTISYTHRIDFDQVNNSKTSGDCLPLWIPLFVRWVQLPEGKMLVAQFVEKVIHGNYDSSSYAPSLFCGSNVFPQLPIDA